jgi:hypothetical protein
MRVYRNRRGKLGLLGICLVLAWLPLWFFILARIDPSADRQQAYAVAMWLTLLIVVGLGARIVVSWKRPLLEFGPGGLSLGHHLLPWEFIDRAEVVTIEGTPTLGFRLKVGAFQHLTPELKKACRGQDWWMPLRLLASVDVAALSVNLDELSTQLQLQFGVSTTVRAEEFLIGGRGSH